MSLAGLSLNWYVNIKNVLKNYMTRIKKFNGKTKRKEREKKKGKSTLKWYIFSKIII